MLILKKMQSKVKEIIKNIIDYHLDRVFAVSAFLMLDLSAFVCVCGWSPYLHIVSVILGLPFIAIICYCAVKMPIEFIQRIKNRW